MPMQTVFTFYNALKWQKRLAQSDGHLQKSDRL